MAAEATVERANEEAAEEATAEPVTAAEALAATEAMTEISQRVDVLFSTKCSNRQTTRGSIHAESRSSHYAVSEASRRNTSN